MKNQIEETNFSPLLTGRDEPKSAAKLHKRMKAVLGLAALLGAALASNLSQADQAGDEVRAFAAAPGLDIILVPERGTKVYVQDDYRYHWRENCPLTSAKSLRPYGEEPSIQRSWMGLGEAEKKNLHPCFYCP